MAANSWKGIPANERDGVSVIRNLMVNKETGKKDSPQKVWREIVAHRKHMDQKRRDEEKQKSEESAQVAEFKRQSAKNAIDTALGHMATTRDMLDRLADGEDYGFPVSELVYLLHVGVVDSMRQMENALVDLGIVDKDAEFFVERHSFDKQAEASNG